MGLDRLKENLQKALYAHKYILFVFYWGIVVGLTAYAIKFLIFLYYFATHFLSKDENWSMIGLLTLIDMCMVANLSKMVTTGSYQAFIDKVPEKTERVSSSLLKVKMGTSLVGVTAIHLLRVFVETGSVFVSNRELYILIGIHLIFVLSSAILSWIDYTHSKSNKLEAESDKIELQIKIMDEKLKNEIHI